MIAVQLLATVLLTQDSGAIRGRIIDAKGAPQPDVRVVLGEFGHATVFFNSPKQVSTATPGIAESEGKRYTAEVTTDAGGEFDVQGLAPGEYSVVAAHETLGIALASIRVRGGGTSSLIAPLVPAPRIEADLRGLPFDPKKHTLELVPETNGTNVEFHPSLEPVRGTWSFESCGLPAIEGWRIVGAEVVFAQAYRATLFSLPVRVAPGEAGATQAFAFDAAQGLEIAGSVQDAAGRPISGVSIVARSTETGAELGAVSDAAGKYRIGGLSKGKHLLQAMRWKLREVPGCGNGAQDVAASREIELPLADDASTAFRIDGLLPAPKVGDPAPDFVCETIDGKRVQRKELLGKVVLLDYWATWCGSCRVEMPGLVDAYEKLAPGGRFEIVGVSLDSDPLRVPRFVRSRSLRWPQTALGPEASNPIARLFNVHSTPSTVLVDGSGNIAALNLLGEPLRRKIEELLASSGAAAPADRR